MTEILSERLTDEPNHRVNPCAEINPRLPMLWHVRKTALVGVLLGLIAGNLLVLSTPVEAAIQKAKPVRVIAPAASSLDDSRVSPYTIVNRQHAATRAEQAPMTALSARRTHNLSSQPH